MILFLHRSYLLLISYSEMENFSLVPSYSKCILISIRRHNPFNSGLVSCTSIFIRKIEDSPFKLMIFKTYFGFEFKHIDHDY